jgi:hypothetical protein
MGSVCLHEASFSFFSVIEVADTNLVENVKQQNLQEKPPKAT